MVGVEVSVGVRDAVAVGMFTVTPLWQPSSNSRSTEVTPSRPIYWGWNRPI